MEIQETKCIVDRGFLITQSILLALAVLTARDVAGQTPKYTLTYAFKGGVDGDSPQGGLVLGKNGGLYGTTYAGGTATVGTVFALVPTGGIWKKSVLHNFTGNPDGSLPHANLTFGSNGKLYGTTLVGGLALGSGAGTIFELAPPTTAGQPWTETVLYSLPGSCTNQNLLYGAVLIGPNGALFGTTGFDKCEPGGLPTGGSVFELTPSPAPATIWTNHTILNLDTFAYGTLPFAGLASLGGSLYGTTYYSGTLNGCGGVFELTPSTTAGGSWTGSLIHGFTGGDGCGSEAALTPGPGGVLYGTTLDGGSLPTPCTFPTTGGCGTVFQVTPPAAPGGNWTETVLYQFAGADGDGAYPAASVVVGPKGVLYGTTQYGGSATSGSPCAYYGATGCGTIFQLTPPTIPGGTWTETILHSFTGQDGDGSIPMAGLTLTPTGTLYGTTSGGGAFGKGLVFSITP